MNRAMLESQLVGTEFAVHAGKEDEYAAFLAQYKEYEWSLSPFPYAQAWGKLMQLRMTGATFTKIARTASFDADVYNGETGVTYVAALSFLVKFWAHGEELRIWHNSLYGVPASEKMS